MQAVNIKPQLQMLVAGNNQLVGVLHDDGTRQPIPTWNTAGTALLDTEGVALAAQRAVGAGVGYATGEGGAVTQGVSKATAFTLSKLTGAITMDGAALAAATIVSATWTNTLIGANDVVAVSNKSVGTLGAYTIDVRCAAGSATLALRNNTAGSLCLSEIHFYFTAETQSRRDF